LCAPSHRRSHIDELLRADIFEDVVEPGFARVEEVAGPINIGIWRAPADIAGAQLVEMGAAPFAAIFSGP